MKDKYVVITGGASGIGKAMVQKYAAAGYKVHFIDVNLDEGRALAQEEKTKGNSATFWQEDISDESAVKNLFEKLPETLDILINNAGISHIGNIENTSTEDFEKVFRVNVKGMFHCVQFAIPKLRKNNGGSILNMASVAASIGLPDRFAYSMTKGAVYAMTLSIARDYVAEGIRCNCISPGRVHTPFVDGFLAKNYPGKEKEMFEKLEATQPIGRMGTPEEIAALAFFVTSDAGSFMTGTDIPIDGGFLGLKM